MRIYLKYVELNSNEISLEDENHHYLKNVLRCKINDEVDVLTDNQLILTNVAEINKKNTKLNIRSVRETIENKCNFTVYQCLLKREYMDTVVSKYAELGLNRVVPVISARSLPSLKENTLKRFKELAKHAVLQSEVEFIPEITEEIKLSDIKAIENGQNIIFYERNSKKTFPKISSPNVQIVIGPEGGFTEEEVDSLVSKGFTNISPISSILKAETAAVVFAGLIKIQLEALNA